MSVELEKLAEAINQKWQRFGGWTAFTTSGWTLNMQKIDGYQKHENGGVSIYYANNDTIPYEPDYSNEYNGAFVAWCLDRLEELEYLNLRLIYNGLGRINPDGSKVARYYISVGACSEINKPFAEGDTRAECCAQALLVALTSLPNTSLSEEENKSNG